MRVLVANLVLVLATWVVPTAHAKTAGEPTVALDATLDAAHEVPPPTGTSPDAGGTATFVFDETEKSLSYRITVQNLTSDPFAGHIHRGAAGVAGPILVALPSIPGANGTATGTVTLQSDDDVQALFDGRLYVNLHTAQNPSGEVRGQIELSKTASLCSCKTAASPKVFKTCVKDRVKALEKSQRKSDVIKLLKKVVKKASCGKTKGPKKAVGCCLPQSPAGNFVIGHLCAAVPEKACTKLGGLGAISLGPGSSCFPNECVPPASPSGAFVDQPISASSTRARTVSHRRHRGQ